MSSLDPEIEWLGRQPYGAVLERQRSRREAIIDRTGRECIWGLEHEPVITSGRRSVADLPPIEWLKERGIAYFQTERGGLATYHGPGQLIVYFLLNLSARRLKVRQMIYGIEEGVIRWLLTRGVESQRRCGYPGVWVNSDKICSVGMHFRRGVSMHGLALNLSTDLHPFELITPCGIEDASMTSLKDVSGETVVSETAAGEVIWHVLAALQLTPAACGDSRQSLAGM